MRVAGPNVGIVRFAPAALPPLGDLPRAQWLAGQVGAKLLGKPVPGR